MLIIALILITITVMVSISVIFIRRIGEEQRQEFEKVKKDNPDWFKEITGPHIIKQKRELEREKFVEDMWKRWDLQHHTTSSHKSKLK